MGPISNANLQGNFEPLKQFGFGSYGGLNNYGAQVKTEAGCSSWWNVPQNVLICLSNFLHLLLGLIIDHTDDHIDLENLKYA